jgi:hypothetical protein
MGFEQAHDSKFILKNAAVVTFLSGGVVDWEDSRLLFLYLNDKLPVFNPDFRAAARAFF